MCGGGRVTLDAVAVDFGAHVDSDDILMGLVTLDLSSD